MCRVIHTALLATAVAVGAPGVIDDKGDPHV
jgi:hypothetical protein